MNKILLAIFLLFAWPALAAYQPVPGTNGQFVYNNNGQWAATGAIPNSALANSSMTIGGQVISLGGSTTNQGTGGKIQLSTGTTTANDCVKFDANGNTVDTGAACGSGSGAVSSVSGDSFLINNSASTGAVTLTQANHTANSVAGALTATTLSDLGVPSCSAAGNALKWTAGTGFGCATGYLTSSGAVTSLSGDGVYITNSGSTGAVTLTTTFGNAAQQTTGTSGATVPLLNGSNTASGNNIQSGSYAITGTSTPTQASGTLGLAGTATKPTLAATAEGDAWLTATGGFNIIGDGSSFDFSLFNKSGTSVCTVATGTTNWNCTGLQVGGVAVSTTTGTVTSIATTSPITGGTITSTGTIACATCATTTNGGALSGTAPIAVSVSGVISAGGAGTVNGALKGNGSGTITQAACADLSNGGTACAQNTGTSGGTVPLLNGANTWSGVQTLSGAAGIDAQSTPAISTATFTPNFAAGNHFIINLVHASCPCTLANPTNIVAGQSGVIAIVQSATGSDLVTSYGGDYIFTNTTAPVLSTTASAIDYLSYYVQDATHIRVAALTSTNTGASQTVSYQPGLLSAVNANIGVYNKVVNASTVDNIIGSAVTFSCVSNPTVTMYECGVSATCTSPTTIGTVTITAAAQAFAGTVSSSAVAAGDYIGFATTAGTCASVDLAVTAAMHAN